MEEFSLLVSHDAGGAEILAALYATMENKPVVYAEGPAVRIFERENIPLTLELHKELRSFSNSSRVLTSTSYPAQTEIQTWRYCLENGIFVAAFIDHWVNYKIRFIPEGNANPVYPDKIYLGDNYALEIAKEQGIPEVKLELINNPYFEKVSKIELQKSGPILFLAEPSALSKDSNSGECTVEKYIDWLRSQDLPYKTIVRPHPRQDTPLNEMVSEDSRLELSVEPNIIDDLKKSAVVVSTESMGLVLADIAGIPSYCILSGDSRLPQPGIKKLTSLSELSRELTQYNIAT